MGNPPGGRRPLAVWLGIGLAVYVILGFFALVFLPGPLADLWTPPPGTFDQWRQVLPTATQVVLLGLGGTIAIVGIALSLSRHRQELQAAQREIARLIDDREREANRRDEVALLRRVDAEREMRARFVTAVELLSDSGSVTTRSAAMYALAALADDWDSAGRKDEVQVCVDVICGHVRSPLPEGVNVTGRDDLSVNAAGYELIREHLIDDAVHSWSECQLDLHEAHIDWRVNLSGAVVKGKGSMSLLGAKRSVRRRCVSGRCGCSRRRGRRTRR